MSFAILTCVKFSRIRIPRNRVPGFVYFLFILEKIFLASVDRSDVVDKKIQAIIGDRYFAKVFDTRNTIEKIIDLLVEKITGKVPVLLKKLDKDIANAEVLEPQQRHKL